MSGAGSRRWQEESHICGQQLLFVVDARHGDLTLADHGEVVRVRRDEKHLCGEERRISASSLSFFLMRGARLTDQLRFVSRHDLVEDVVAPLLRQLEGHSGLLQQVCARAQAGIVDIILQTFEFLTEGNKLTGFNVSGRQFSCGSEVNPDEFTLRKVKG